MKKSSAIIFFMVAAGVFALGKCTAGQGTMEQRLESEASARYAELKALREARRNNSIELDASLQQLNDLYIPDPSLANCIERAVSHALTHSGGAAIASATDITSLECSRQSIKRLTGLEHFTRLTKLDLSYNQIENADTLNNLHDLQTLDLTNNQVKNIWGLQGLDKLTRLKLNNNPVTDLQFISGFEQLEQLEFSLDSNQRCDYLASIKSALKQSKASLSIPGRCVDEFGEPARLNDFE